MSQKTIAYISHSPSEYSTRVALGISKYVAQQGDLTLQILGRQGFIPLWDVGGFCGDGVIGMFDSLEQMDFYRQQGIPVINTSTAAELKPRVVIDNYTIGSLAADYFLQRQYQHYVCLTLPNLATYSELRQKGFCERVAAANQQVRRLKLSTMITQTAENWYAGIEEMIDQLHSLPKPLALFCDLDIVARLVSQACEKADIRVPEDVAIMGVDNDELICNACRIPLTSIEQGEDRVGFLAAEKLHQLLNGKTIEDETVLPPIGVVPRRSTNADAFADEAILRAIKVLRSSYQESSLQIEDLRLESGLSRRLFELRFKKAIGRTPARELLRMRLEKARQLLLISESSLDEISETCGFKRRERFQEAFKRFFDLAPGTYRKRYK